MTRSSHWIPVRLRVIWSRWSRPALPLVVVAGLLCLGAANVAARATWRGVEDGVLWKQQGQDIVAAEGLAVVTPLPGVVKFVTYQEGGAGWYIVLDADDGRSLFMAHLQAGSIGVAPGQRVAPGQPLARVGSTGSSTGPHLHFELWMGGWRDRGGTPIDPLPQLQAWAG